MNANDPAFPVVEIQIDDLTGRGRHEGMAAVQYCQRPGLTIREHMATQIMTGLLAAYVGATPMPKAEDAADDAVEYAEALIARLNITKV